MASPSQTKTDAPPAARGGLLRFAIFLVVAIAVAALFRLAVPNVSDPDSFYHFRHAAIYGQKGLGYAAFPWLVYSPISRYSADIAYGFHLLLIPFTRLRDAVFGIRLAAVFETVMVMLLLYWVMRRHRLAYPSVWPLSLLFVGPPMMFTFMQTRPQTLTMGFAAVLFSFMISGSSLGVLLGSFGISFFHSNAFPIVFVIAAVASVAKVACERTCPPAGGRAWKCLPGQGRKWLAVIAGVALGLGLRPNPLGAAKLEYVQVAVHELVRRRGIPLRFGAEWLPVSPQQMSEFTWFTVAWVALAVVFIAGVIARRRDTGWEPLAGQAVPRYTMLWGSLVLSACFFALMLLSTKRATPLWAAFAVLFVANTFTCFLNPQTPDQKQWLKRDTRLVFAWVLVAVFAMMVWEVTDAHLLRPRPQWHGRYADRMEAAAGWLASHSRDGGIVYNVNWDDFPELFFWNTKDRYVWGLDPIFLFAYDQGLCWKAHHLAVGDGAEYTTASPDYRMGKKEPTYQVLKRDFRASFIVLNPRTHSTLNGYLASDPRFQREPLDDNPEDDIVAVYAIK